MYFESTVGWEEPAAVEQSAAAASSGIDTVAEPKAAEPKAKAKAKGKGKAETKAKASGKRERETEPETLTPEKKLKKDIDDQITDACRLQRRQQQALALGHSLLKEVDTNPSLVALKGNVQMLTDLEGAISKVHSVMSSNFRQAVNSCSTHAAMRKLGDDMDQQTVLNSWRNLVTEWTPAVGNLEKERLKMARRVSSEKAHTKE